MMEMVEMRIAEPWHIRKMKKRQKCLLGAERPAVRLRRRRRRASL